MGHPPQIPLTPQTDERKFPQWEHGAPRGRSGHGYPRMLTRPATKQDREDFRERTQRVDDRTGKTYWEGRPPKVGDPIPVTATMEMVESGHAAAFGDPIIVDNPDKERELLELYGESLGLGVPESIPSAGVYSYRSGQRAADMVVPQADPELEQLRRENEAMKLQLEQIKLRQQLKEQGIDPDQPNEGDAPKRKPGRPRQGRPAEAEAGVSTDDAASVPPHAIMDYTE